MKSPYEIDSSGFEGIKSMKKICHVRWHVNVILLHTFAASMQYIYTQAYMYTCVCVNVYVHKYVWMCMYIYIKKSPANIWIIKAEGSSSDIEASFAA